MSSFTVRVELNNPGPGDYDDLHKKMAAAGFSKIIISNDGKKYHLPDAEYNYESESTSTEQVLDKAYAVAKAVQGSPRVLVTKSNGRMWQGLKPV